MKKFTFIISIILSAIGCISYQAHARSIYFNAGCADAGLANASADSVCYNTNVTLSLTGYVGTIFQWQSFDGSVWNNETGPGATTDTYVVSLQLTADFRAIVSDVGCPADTSNIVTINVGVIPVPTASNVTRCGPGNVNLTGSGNGTLQWYDNINATVPIATGSPASVYVPATTTLYVSDQTLGAGGANSPIIITEFELTTSDNLELQNVSPFPVDVTGWKVAVSDSYTDINLANVIVQPLTGVMNPGDIINFTDNAAGPNYWGNNIFWAAGAFPGFAGWALIIDDQNILREFVVWNWPDATIQSMSTVINGATLTPGTLWTGDGINSNITGGGISFQRIVSQDNNNSSDFVDMAVSTNLTNPGLTLPFTGFGCNSPLVPVEVTITPADAVTINASATSFCLNGSATLDATSVNSNYVYTWSPATGLNTTSGPTVIATPPGPGTITYVVTGDDGTCSNVDTVTISVGAPTMAGTASTFQDTICLGKTTDLILTGSVGDIQWQKFDGSVWVNETDPGFNTAAYTVAPIVNSTYRAYLSSGSCPPDSSASIDIEVLSITDPTTSDTSICGSGTVTLNASGQGTLSWYASPTSAVVVNNGTSYTFSASSTTTYYVEAFAGSEFHVGPLTSGIGNQTATASNNAAVGFDVIRPVTIDFVHLYPNQTGNVTINLRQSAGGPILATHTASVTAFTGKTSIPVGFSVPVGTGYRMEVAAGGVTLGQNTTGAVYPYTAANGPLSITGYYNPNFASGGIYLYLYDWVVSEGCRSNRIPATVTVNSFPAIPTISQNWNFLTSSSPVGNQWNLNGNPIPGATGQIHEATVVGNYSVSVTINGCTTTSAVFQVTFVGENEIGDPTISMYPNPVSDELNIAVAQLNTTVHSVSMLDVTGRVVLVVNDHQIDGMNVIKINTASLRQGIYFLEMSVGDQILRKRFALKR